MGLLSINPITHSNSRMASGKNVKSPAQVAQKLCCAEATTAKQILGAAAPSGAPSTYDSNLRDTDIVFFVDQSGSGPWPVYVWALSEWTNITD